MTRSLLAAVAALSLAAAVPVTATAGDCPGDCANCPRKAGAAAKGDKAGDDKAGKAPATADCGCAGGAKCTCKDGCKCGHAGHDHGEKGPEKAPSKT